MSPNSQPEQYSLEDKILSMKTSELKPQSSSIASRPMQLCSPPLNLTLGPWNLRSAVGVPHYRLDSLNTSNHPQKKSGYVAGIWWATVVRQASRLPNFQVYFRIRSKRAEATLVIAL